jgi:hypothetical protein
LLGCACAGLPLGGNPAFAHHSFAAEFDAAQPVTLVGAVTRMERINRTRGSIST